MSRRRRRSRDYTEEEEPDVSIIPLIDVMFLLLCFFVFLTLAMVLQEGIPVELASAESGDPRTIEKDQLVVSVKSNGALFLNKKKMTEKKLLEKLKQVAEQSADRVVLINAARRSEHQRVMSAMDLIREAGLSNVVFTVKPEASQ